MSLVPAHNVNTGTEADNDSNPNDGREDGESVCDSVGEVHGWVTNSMLAV